MAKYKNTKKMSWKTEVPKYKNKQIEIKMGIPYQ